MRARPFVLVYASQVKNHLQTIDRSYHSLIRKAIEQQLRAEPEVETRNRKPLRRGPILGAEWELRLGPDNRFRVFYEVNRAEGVVAILAVGVKDRNRLLIAGKDVHQ